MFSFKPTKLLLFALIFVLFSITISYSKNSTFIKKNRILKQTKFFKIVAPVGGESWELNNTATIYWDSGNISGKLACELFKDRNKIQLISRNIPINQRSYQWKVRGKNIMPGGGYQIRLTTLSDKKSYVSKLFSILDVYQPTSIKKYTLQKQKLTIIKKDTTTPKPIKLTVLSPKYQEHWKIFREYPIRWESEGLTKDDEIGIALKTTGHGMAKIITITKNTGEFHYQVPYPIIFTGYDIRVILTPLKDRSIEVLSDPFAIMKPQVDLIASNPSVHFKFKKRKRKWWEKIGDIFTGGITFYINEAVELTRLKVEGATMTIELYVIQKGSKTLSNVQVDCEILEQGYNIIHSFDRKIISTLRPDRKSKIVYNGATKQMGLKKGTYTLEVNIDPFNRQGEMDRIRGNNKTKIEFEIK